MVARQGCGMALSDSRLPNEHQRVASPIPLHEPLKIAVVPSILLLFHDRGNFLRHALDVQTGSSPFNLP